MENNMIPIDSWEGAFLPRPASRPKMIFMAAEQWKAEMDRINQNLERELRRNSAIIFLVALAITELADMFVRHSTN